MMLDVLAHHPWFLLAGLCGFVVMVGLMSYAGGLPWRECQCPSCKSLRGE